MPLTATAAMVGSFGIMGIPFFNGYTSKTLLHHALVESYKHHDLFCLILGRFISPVLGNFMLDSYLLKNHLVGG